MNYYFTYQQADTSTVKKLKDLSSTVKLPNSLNIGVKVIPNEKLRIDTVLEREKAVPAPIQQQPGRIRNREILTVDSSVFVKPQAEIKMTVGVVTPQDIILPVRRLNSISNDWLTVALILCLILFASVRKPFANYISHLFKATLNYPTSSRMYRERSYSIVDGAFRLDVLFYFIFSLFVYQSVTTLKTELPFQNFQLYLICYLFVVGYFVLKRTVYIMVGFVNKGQAETEEYLFNLNNYNRVLGLFLFPIVTIIAFSPVFKPIIFVVSGLILTAVFYGMSLQRGILILLKEQFSIYYLFLYLCSLEILPLLLIYKMVLE